MWTKREKGSPGCWGAPRIWNEASGVPDPAHPGVTGLTFVRPSCVICKNGDDGDTSFTGPSAELGVPAGTSARLPLGSPPVSGADMLPGPGARGLPPRRPCSCVVSCLCSRREVFRRRRATFPSSPESSGMGLLPGSQKALRFWFRVCSGSRVAPCKPSPGTFTAAFETRFLSSSRFRCWAAAVFPPDTQSWQGEESTLYRLALELSYKI